MTDLRELFGNIDIYLFDQIIKNRFSQEMKILDAGCGGGRNLVYFLRENFQIYAVDQNAEAIEQIRRFAQTVAPRLPPDNFQVSTIEKMPYQNASFDWVISSAVLHFARDERHFKEMLGEMWRVLKPGGFFFARLASSIGIEKLIEPVGSGRYSLPDGSERFLVDEELLNSMTEQLGGIWLEPLKTTNVQNLRCMTTWVLQKGW
jgi:ubiquinone/menaquinone biosynthesis C-methylase UbiE